MKITDCDKEARTACHACFVCLAVMVVLFVCSPYTYDAGQIAGMVICLLLLLAIFTYAYAETTRYYLVDDKGITGCFLGGKIKVHFNWEDFQSLVLCSVYVRRPKPIGNYLYLSTVDISGKTPQYLYKHSNRMQIRHRKFVYFKFKIERYQYIKQFCPLELVDKRKSKDGY